VKRYYIVVGDKATSGVIAMEGIEDDFLFEKPFAFVGGRLHCPACKTTGVIGAWGPRWPEDHMGKMPALSGDPCICQCHPAPRFIAWQDVAFMFFEAHELAEMGFRRVERDCLRSQR
jgi:hypothetical protein